MDSTYGSMGRKTSGWIALLVLWVERFIDKREGENYLRELLPSLTERRRSVREEGRLSKISGPNSLGSPDRHPMVSRHQNKVERSIILGKDTRPSLVKILYG